MSPHQMKVFQEAQLSQFKVFVLEELDRSYALFPHLTQEERHNLVSRYVDSSLRLGFKIQRAVLNYVVACWFAQEDLADDGVTTTWLAASTLDEVRTTEKLKRSASLRYYAAQQGLATRSRS